MDKRSEHTRQLLVDATAGLIAEGRFTDAGLVNICRAAGVSRGALYHHFDSIADLVAEVYAQARVRVDGLVEEAFSHPPAKAPAGFSIALCRALLDEHMVRAGVRVGPDGTSDPPRLREEALARMREQMVTDCPGSDAAADLAVVVTAGLESLGHTDVYWWQPKTVQRIWGLVHHLDGVS
ncbi:TetR/AcrR family transcriptional regulator [Streptomyces brasiliscabiei]|uniref:TetR/AcrR family transcriptional regulator n=1 Tax=Streptomyces brasiliscabiei TaxID=2736302 RepID=A0ABU8GUC8_9ACTN